MDEARLAPLVLDEAEAGDRVATAIVEGFGRQLGLHAVAAARRVGLGPEPFPLVLAGGVDVDHAGAHGHAVVGGGGAGGGHEGVLQPVGRGGGIGLDEEGGRPGHGRRRHRRAAARDARRCRRPPQRTATVFERPHTEANYLTKEMGFVVARKHARSLRTLSLVLFAALPILLLVPAWMFVHLDTAPWYAAAALCALAGAFVERWLFFAEAKHMVTLYY